MKTIKRSAWIKKETDKAVLVQVNKVGTTCIFEAWLPKSLINITNRHITKGVSNFGCTITKFNEADIEFPIILINNFKTV